MTQYDRRSRYALYAVAVAGLLASLQIVTSRPLEPNMPVYLDLAGRLQAGPVAESFEPLGYSWLITLIPGDSLAVSAKRLHWICYALLVVLVVVAGRRFLASAEHNAGTTAYRPLIILLAAFVILNPYVLANLVRLNDNNVNVPAVLGLFVFLQSRPDRSAAAWRFPVAGLAGACLGALALVRPNVVSLFPFLVFVFWRYGRTEPRGYARVAGLCASAGVAAIVAYSVGSLLISGRPNFWPGNGPYNLFAGNNPASRAALGRDYNAEYSLAEGLSWCGVSADPRLVPPARYVDCTRRFVRENPGEALALGAIKLHTTLFRPNLRLADSFLKAAVQWSLIALPVAWWTASILILLRERRVLDAEAAMFVLLYALPFVVTNADPRFRLPLDAVYALSLMQHIPWAKAGEPVPLEGAARA